MGDLTRRLVGGLLSGALFLIAVLCGFAAAVLAPWPSTTTIFEYQYVLSVPLALLAWGAWTLAQACWPD